MIKFNSLVFGLAAALCSAQTLDQSKAPNSYIFDTGMAKAGNYGGLIIPVAKAYAMWSDYKYLKTDGQPTPIPTGVQSASMYWEDTPGLIQEVSLIPGSTASGSKIKVNVNKGAGKGNAVIAFKVDGVIYWSWHVWVTDNPENGVAYGHGTETDAAGNPISIHYMDRNLGASAAGFLGNDWHRSGGLMYEWGRKDPFPPLVHKDATYYQITGEVGVMRHRQIDAQNTIPVEVRPFDDIEKNMAYAVKNPITYLINTDAAGNWFSNSRYRVAGASPNYMTWDLWSDNAKGGNSNGNSSNTALKNESRSYEIKSELDPCPAGWRVPSYLGRETQNNNLAFYGRHDWNNDDSVLANRQLFPDSMNPNLHGVKVYPGLGMDFSEAQSGARNIGILPVSGAYVYYPNAAAPAAPVGVMFQDNAANGGLWSSTFGYDGARIFSMISDPMRTNTSVGLHAIYNNITNPTKAGNAVRCMRDPNLNASNTFVTEYFASVKENFTEGLDTPNSYIVTNETMISIPVSKPFSVYNQMLSDQEMLSTDDLEGKIIWTTNTKLISRVFINLNPDDPRLSTLEVILKPGERGNAVIALKNGSKADRILWSWHIWAPESDPRSQVVTYTTENPVPTTYNFVNATVSKSPALTTVFMDRNLGALTDGLDDNKSNVLQYQWGRKDPLPALNTPQAQIFVPAAHPLAADVFGDRTSLMQYDPVSSFTYQYEYTVPYSEYGGTVSGSAQVKASVLYSIQNPLRFMYQQNIGALYDGGNHYANDLSKIKDWISHERAEATDRWGHGDRKSPFDPCPEGWRVPDVSSVKLYSGSKGSSPWYNGYNADAYGKSGVIQDQWHDVSQFYGGTVKSNGWELSGGSYNLGNFTKDGVRGELGGNKLTMDRTGVWTAAMADLRTGFALAMMFQGNKMQTGTGAYPQAAMGVRCAKDDPRLLGERPNKDNLKETLQNLPAALPKAAVLEEAEIKVYPNPFSAVFKIEGKEAASAEMYDMTGKLVLKSATGEGEINGAGLPNGIYLLKINTAKGKAVTKKMIKR